MTTPSGRVELVDLDAAIQALPAAPPLVWIDATPGGGVVGITATGEVHQTSDPKGTWTAAVRVPGNPAALDAGDAAWYVASDQGIYRSTDRGATWTEAVGE